VGNPFDEIVREAREQQVQFILVPTFASSFWRRLLAPLAHRVAERLAADAPCPVFALRAKTPFNCEERWGSEKDVPDSVRRNSKRQSPLTSSLAVLQSN
jgi:hypothetical protein